MCCSRDCVCPFSAAPHATPALTNREMLCCLCVHRAQVPPLKWAENKDDIFLTVDVSGAKDAKVAITKDKVTFTGSAGGKSYAFDMDLSKEVDEKVCNLRCVWASSANLAPCLESRRKARSRTRTAKSRSCCTRRSPASGACCPRTRPSSRTSWARTGTSGWTRTTRWKRPRRSVSRVAGVRVFA